MAIPGTLTLNGNVTTLPGAGAIGQVLLQANSGIVQDELASVISSDQLLLGGDDANEGSGDVELDGNNLVSSLAGNLQDSLLLVNSVSLEIGDLDYSSDCGTMEAICGLAIGGNLDLTVTGDLTQTAAVIVQGTTDLVVTGDICLIDGDCTGDGMNDNDFVGLVTAAGRIVEIADANDLNTGVITATDRIFLRSGDNGTGAITLDGNLTVTAANGEVLLQSDSGVTQDSGVINAFQLMVGGNDADEGSGVFLLDQANQVSELAGELLGGSLQLVNVGNLTVVASANYVNCAGGGEVFTGIQVHLGDQLETASFGDPNVDLDDTIQGAVGDVGDRYNPNPDFTEFLDTTNVGLAIANSGNLTLQHDGVAANFLVTATGSDVYLQTLAGGNVNLNDTVAVIGDNRILTIAGGNLLMANDAMNGIFGSFVRVDAGNNGLVVDKFNDLLLQNEAANAIVDPNTFIQQLEFLVGTPFEEIYHTSVFWGIEGPEDNTFDLPTLNPTELDQLTTLLFDGGDNFEFRTFFGPPFDGVADGLVENVESQPFDVNFLRTNSEFRNVQVMFNDAQINLFENATANAGNDLIDLNVATADFQGLANINIPPEVISERVEFQTPERVEISRPEEVVSTVTTIAEEQPLLVQNVYENFVVVVYFEDQYTADQFESSFEQLGGENDTGEIDYQQVQKLLKERGLNALEWDTSDESEAFDVNQIREILERAGLDLGDDDDDWVERYKQWLKDNPDSESPQVPRGVFKIIEVDNGKAVIQGDDVDRRFVPEPSDESGQDYEFKVPASEADGAGDPETSHHELPGQRGSDRLTRWAAILNSSADTNSHADLVGQGTVTESSETDSLGGAGASVGVASVLATLLSQTTKSDRQLQQELDALQAEKQEQQTRNIFSRAARFLRRSRQRMSAEDDR